MYYKNREKRNNVLIQMDIDGTCVGTVPVIGIAAVSFLNSWYSISQNERLNNMLETWLSKIIKIHDLMGKRDRYEPLYEIAETANRKNIPVCLVSDRSSSLRNEIIDELVNSGIHIGNEEMITGLYLRNNEAPRYHKPEVARQNVDLGYSVVHIDDNPLEACAISHVEDTSVWLTGLVSFYRSLSTLFPASDITNVTLVDDIRSELEHL